jgi:hypothetical protein
MTALYPQAGKTGLSFLKIGAGSRNIAMGDIGVLFANDASSVFYNPSYLAGMKNDDVMLMHNQWIQDIASEVFAARITIFGVPIGIGLNSTSIQDIEIRTRPGEKEGTFNAHYFMGSLSSGFALNEKVSVGATVKYLYEGLFADESTGWAFDFAGVYNNIIDHVSVAVSLKNLGSMNKLASESSTLPAELRIGAAYNAYQIGDEITVNGGIELQKYLKTDEKSFHINLGAEGWYNDVFALRLGYMALYDSKSITTGIGVKYQSLRVDYAFTPFSYQLGNAHTVSLAIGF